MKIIEGLPEHYASACPLFAALDAYHADIQPTRVRNQTGPARTLEKYCWYIEGDDRALLLAKDGEEYVGFTNFWVVEVAEEEMRVGQKYIHLDNIFVVPEQRHRQIASALIKAVIEWGKARNISKVELQVFENNPAQIVYEKLGFQTYMKKMEFDI